ncbi:hypothetical protein Taro_020348 [Colocasia esculenta]|uniref:Uncharacterized protein n=1 Tax=Colocasia esculenta TaxID=4460 RepID=A0A843UNG5_COLES|nr:hypothetical protein [Colocasia esculenta]
MELCKNYRGQFRVKIRVISHVRFGNELGSFGGRLGLQRRRRKAGNRSFIPLHPLLHPERRLVLGLHKGSDEEPEETDGLGQE